jgi:putative ABC transport system permease protein
VTTGLYEQPDLAGAGHGGVVARRAVIRWAWRLFRREWRQQVLVVALLAVAVAATVLGVAVAANTPSSPAATFGTASAQLTVPGTDPHLAADIASLRRQFGKIDVIENARLAGTGTVQPVDLRAQDPRGPYGRPMLALVSGRYPSGLGQAAVTSQVAALFNLRTGGVWHTDGRAWRVTGLVENPASLQDEFVLVAPGQVPGKVSVPAQVTVLFDASPASVAGLSLPGGALAQTRMQAGRGISPATLVLALASFGLIFIGLVSVAGFTAMAQRRLRAFGMLGSVGATSRHIRLVTVASGVFAGVSGSLAGAGLGFAAWLAYVPHLEAAAGHVIDPLSLPWPALAVAVLLAVVTAVAAASRPGRSAARMPVVAALSGRPAPARARRRIAGPGLALLAAGLGCLAFSGGWDASLYHGTGALLLFAGIVATSAGGLVLAPLGVAVPAAVARRAPVAVRLALRDLGRYRARSGAALAAATFAVFLAVLTCILATARFGDPLRYVGPNLAANQLIIYEPHGLGSGYSGLGPAPTPAQQRALEAKVNALAASFHARFVLPLDSAGRPNPAPVSLTVGVNQAATLWQATSTGTLTRAEAIGKDKANYQGPLYLATPALLRAFGIGPGQVAPDTDILTARAGLAAVPGLDLLGPGDVVSRYTPSGHEISESYRCVPGNCIVRPTIQTLAGLPTGTSAPNTVITEHAARALGLTLVPDGWLIQTTGAITPAQQDAARQLALAAQSFVETDSGLPGVSEITGGAIAAAILLALGVLAATAGLIRAETARDLRTLTAVGAGSGTRRTITAVTAGTLGLLGAVGGTALAYLAVTAWAHGRLDSTLGHVPAADLIAILAGLPLAAAAGGWLMSGRQPPAIARQPLE